MARLRSAYECGCPKNPMASYPNCMYGREYIQEGACRGLCGAHLLVGTRPQLGCYEEAPATLQAIAGPIGKGTILGLTVPAGRMVEVNAFAPFQKARLPPRPPAPQTMPYHGMDYPDVMVPGLLTTVAPIPNPYLLPIPSMKNLHQARSMSLYHEPPYTYWHQNARKTTGVTYYRDWQHPFRHYSTLPVEPHYELDWLVSGSK